MRRQPAKMRPAIANDPADAAAITPSRLWSAPGIAMCASVKTPPAANISMNGRAIGGGPGDVSLKSLAGGAAEARRLASGRRIRAYSPSGTTSALVHSARDTAGSVDDDGGATATGIPAARQLAGLRVARDGLHAAEVEVLSGPALDLPVGLL